MFLYYGFNNYQLTINLVSGIHPTHPYTPTPLSPLDILKHITDNMLWHL